MLPRSISGELPTKKNRSPYYTQASYDGKADRITYYPATKLVFSEQSKQADDLRGQEFSRSWSMADAD